MTVVHVRKSLKPVFHAYSKEQQSISRNERIKNIMYIIFTLANEISECYLVTSLQRCDYYVAVTAVQSHLTVKTAALNDFTPKGKYDKITKCWSVQIKTGHLWYKWQGLPLTCGSCQVQLFESQPLQRLQTIFKFKLN